MSPTLVEAPFVWESVTSPDSQEIAYRRYGQGPAVVLVHGGGMASQSYTKLASLLADRFTVIVPDRRHRHRSSHGGARGLGPEKGDMLALLEKTGARQLYGLSSGAMLALHTAAAAPRIERVALYEPPFMLPETPTIIDFFPLTFAQIEKKDYGGALASVIKGTGDDNLIKKMPRFLLKALFTRVIAADQKKRAADTAPISELLEAFAYDMEIVREGTRTLPTFSTFQTETLLLGGNQSARYLRQALDALEKTLPNARRVRFTGVGHLASTNDGKPWLVADVLKGFFK